MMKCIFQKNLFSQQLDGLYIQWEDSFLKVTPAYETTPYISWPKISILYNAFTLCKLIQPPDLWKLYFSLLCSPQTLGGEEKIQSRNLANSSVTKGH